ncbi:hypothetical protein NC652_026300 [Populus alba x Populus x berolinensis]|nr:hypothetical protein NC652_026300 [Populus alba x Populus x berolinensis]
MRPLAKLMILAGFQIYSRLFPGKEKTANPPPNIHPKKKKKGKPSGGCFCVRFLNVPDNVAWYLQKKSKLVHEYCKLQP